MLNKIFFATTNSGKILEAKILLGIEIEGCGLEIEEIQSLDPIKVVQMKVRDYYKELQKPVLVEDVSLVFTALGKLPGTYINDFSKCLGNEGLVKLFVGATNRGAVAQTTLAFYDGKQEHIFEGIVEGSIAEQIRGTNGFGWDPIFIPAGQTKTFAEMENSEKNKYSMRARAFEKFAEWLKNT